MTELIPYLNWIKMGLVVSVIAGLFFWHTTQVNMKVQQAESATSRDDTAVQ